MTKNDCAIQLRDAVLAILQRSSESHHYANYSTLTDQGHSVRIVYRTPFLRLPEKSGASDRETKQYGPYTATQLHQHSKKSLPYTLNVWCGRRKVLNIEWADDGTVELGTYEPGDWEELLLAGAHTKGATRLE
jgi:hypothetical protein